MPETRATPLSILVCDDEPRFRAMLEDVLRGEGHKVRTVGDGGLAIDELRSKERYDLVITDMRMPGHDGFAVLDAARSSPSSPAVVAITGYASIDETVQAIRHGAADYLAKPFPLDRLLEVVSNVTKDRHAQARPRHAPTHVPPALPEGDISFGFVGKSDAMRAVYARLLRLAALDATVLIQGETGTGKELAAVALHDLSPRKRAQLVRVNCPNIDRSLFESALFGHVRGSFTGATEDKDGLFHAAAGGTIFLDEVGEIPLDLQSKLLRVIERKEFLRVGETTPERVDVRIVAASNRDLEAVTHRGLFREDLFFRLSGFTVALPPLRERAEDIPLLVRHFAARFARDIGKEPPEIPGEVLGRLVAHEWPGNVRELENTVRSLVVSATGPIVFVSDLPARIAARTPARVADDGTGAADIGYHAARDRVLEVFERHYFTDLVRSAGGNLSAAARKAGLDRKSLRVKLRKLGIDLRATPGPPGSDATSSGGP